MATVVSNLNSEFHGSIGNLTFVEGQSGTYVRPKTIPHDPHTLAQSRVRHNMTVAANLYHNLNSAQLLAWQAYSKALPPQFNANGKATKFRACDLFTKLTLKFLQVTPHGSPPLLPPAVRFVGDSVGVTAALMPGLVLFTADAPNSLNVVTELLLQPLASVVRTPSAKRYGSQGFFDFRAGILDFGVEVRAGVYVPAYRFVHVPTGQESPLVPLPLLEVV